MSSFGVGVAVALRRISGSGTRNGWLRVGLASVVGLTVSLAARTLEVPAQKTQTVHSAAEPDARQLLGIPWLPESVAAWSPQILAAAERHQVAPELVAIVALVESGGHPEAVSPSGAVGLMQVMPATATDIARHRGMSDAEPDLRDPGLNLDFGAWYLADQLKRFGRTPDEDWEQSVAFAAAAYNGGPGSVQRHVSSGDPLPAETERYRAWVLGMWRERRSSHSQTFQDWLAAGGWRLVDAASASTLAMAAAGGPNAASVTGLAP
jgi:hypothetical protein